MAARCPCRRLKSRAGPLVPQAFSDLESEPRLAIRREEYQAEGIQAMFTVPLMLHGRMAGTLVFYYRTPHNFTERETTVAGVLGNLAAAAIGTADLYERQQDLRAQAERLANRAAFLAEAGAVLSSSLEYQATLANVAELLFRSSPTGAPSMLLTKREGAPVGPQITEILKKRPSRTSCNACSPRRITLRSGWRCGLASLCS